MVTAVEERFNTKWVVDSDTGCHIWTASLRTNGYGQFWDGTNDRYAHRYAWRRKHGEIPKGIVIHHLCKNKKCININHLQAITYFRHLHDNIMTLTSINAAKTRCPAGHPYNDVNTHRFGPNKKWRRCRICNNEVNKRKYWEKKKL